MKVAVFSESEADEAAISMLVSALVGMPLESIQPKVRSRGWPSVKNTLNAVVNQLYWRPDVDGLVVVADSDSTTAHSEAHEAANWNDPDCRLCVLKSEARRIKDRLCDRPGGSDFFLAFGLATPCLEAWLLCGTNPNVSEAAWINAFKSGGKRPYECRQLKRQLYGKDRVSLSEETAVMQREAERLIGQLDLLERNFPGGFGALARDLRAWPKKQPERSIQ